MIWKTLSLLGNYIWEPVFEQWGYPRVARPLPLIATASCTQWATVSKSFFFYAGSIYDGQSYWQLAQVTHKLGDKAKRGRCLRRFWSNGHLSCIPCLFSCISFIRSDALLLNQPPAPRWCWSNELGEGSVLIPDWYHITGRMHRPPSFSYYFTIVSNHRNEF